ncbi:glycosyltransferase family 1 protein [Absiella sp. AM54-8XD]|jgi:glycosyltransferase involved in cell wall biosynthesis|uniref:Glycosyltransferase n=2 Tax=Amedibacillus TaxID=2749846 RepID=A0A7G9GPC5_9FIRM|nr:MULTISPECIES: glycosyltransferase [Bacillota]QNM12657.1 glycosyltransferase [[Eubacterium] hominis]MCH4284029.1 glycosyltransferase [Amedibacillus hominis]RGB57714.1 glycosyltransferase family 1 protein [Absiella sp. AM22-9]RGB62180.1 glycosyltransferase family 1 protein [Absiella sp. AM10-20]RGC15240.1 glycosyltransferase family 1 protein [Absiella sp. AM54-8XD]
MRKAIVVGWINKGKEADCGETMKNQLMIKRLEELGVECIQLDFKNWKKHPWVLVSLLANILFNRDSTLIMSTSVQNVYPIMKLLKIIKSKQNTVNWVIGGSLGNYVLDGKYDKNVIGYVKHTIVESIVMKEQLSSVGIDNVIVKPNFKPISYYPPLKNDVNYNKLRFVFIGRIMAEKGCTYIMQTAEQLNDEGYKDKFEITFYGKIADQYEDEFTKYINSLDNVSYGGFLNMQVNSSYNELSSFDMMLFPTYWKGEGFAGIIIDAFVSGLPIIASDWAHNKIFLKEGLDTIFVEVHDITALKKEMKNCIDGKYDLISMKNNARIRAKEFDVNNVITEELLKEIEI